MFYPTAFVAAAIAVSFASGCFAAGPVPGAPASLEGIWNYSTLTPLERPRELAGKPFLTEAEAAYLEKSILQQVDSDRRDGPAEVDVNRSYNQLFWDGGTKLARVDGKITTSLIIDPSDGRIPPLTPEAQKREAVRRAARRARGRADSWKDRN